MDLLTIRTSTILLVHSVIDHTFVDEKRYSIVL